jgi:hypothetical protein
LYSSGKSGKKSSQPVDPLLIAQEHEKDAKAADKAKALDEAQNRAINAALEINQKKEDERKKTEAEREAKKTATEKEKEKKKLEKEKEDDDEMKKYVIPDDASGAIELPSVQQVEAKLMQNKRPANPNGGLGSSNIDPSSPPPQRRGGTVAYIDTDAGLALSGGSGRKLIIGGGYTDPGRHKLDLEPMSAEPPPVTELWA